MTILILTSLLGIGLILILLEVLFIPGTTVVGIFGLVVSLAGIAYAFASFSPEIAWWIASIATLLNVAAVVYGFRSGVWDKFSLKGVMQGGTFDDRTTGLEVGMSGKALSDIKPIGKALINDQVYEVKSDSGFITVDSVITIVKVETNKIIVK
ncbi:MAG: NfeD family protein [Bacteroidota bacterium]|uniref:NfeD-like C-terminal, partner-binding n=1 Tax=Algoriphagus faecimaris TaxID=686796 RepID=A0A1G6UNV7_9BACT|nr:NfeD family protein [Algoriphagus faecimaris]SDD42235.1 NfeD-like C-terminal, partner-binding [Algoriphagus faecimaris]